MGKRLGFRNNMDYNVFDFNSRYFNLENYKRHIAKLKECGTIEIEHFGRNLQLEKQKQRAKDAIKAIHDLDMEAILYTGIFGGINAKNSNELKSFAQRNKEGKLLSEHNLGEGSAMMCPSSEYVERVMIPQVSRTLEFAAYDGIFLDTPWIMKGGCYCENCYELREEVASEGKNQVEINAINVRGGLERFVTAIKKDHPHVKISVNASAPGLNFDYFHGAEIDNLAGLFDQYVTEWSPHRMRQTVSFGTRCIKKAVKIVEEIESAEGIEDKKSVDINGKFYHATTCTYSSGIVIPADRLSMLFHTILEGGALPRLGIAFGDKGLGIIKEAWESAVENYGHSIKNE